MLILLIYFNGFLLQHGVSTKNLRICDEKMYGDEQNGHIFNCKDALHKAGSHSVLCGVEITTVTETIDGSISTKREISILSDTTLEKLYIRKSDTANEIVQYEISESGTDEGRVLNFTTIHKYETSAVREYRKCFCGPFEQFLKEFNKWRNVKIKAKNPTYEKVQNCNTLQPPVENSISLSLNRNLPDVSERNTTARPFSEKNNSPNEERLFIDAPKFATVASYTNTVELDRPWKLKHYRATSSKKPKNTQKTKPNPTKVIHETCPHTKVSILNVLAKQSPNPELGGAFHLISKPNNSPEVQENSVPLAQENLKSVEEASPPSKIISTSLDDTMVNEEYFQNRKTHLEQAIGKKPLQPLQKLPYVNLFKRFKKVYMEKKMKNATKQANVQDASEEAYENVMAKDQTNNRSKSASEESLYRSSIEVNNCKTLNDTFECTTEGRFPDYADQTCTSYYCCSKIDANTLIQNKYKCSKSKYNPITRACSKQYVCPCAPICKVTNEDFQCETAGRFADLSDLTCKRYFLCSVLRNGTILKNPYTCRGATFDPYLHKCSAEYDCPCSNVITKPPTEATVLPPCKPPSLEYVFHCEENGRFADVYDRTCSRYFLCTKLHNGTFIKTEYACIGSSFNPLLGKCVENYYCPCGGQETTGTTELTTHTSSQCAAPSPGYVFNCEENGRFADVYDGTCSKYFLCTKLQNGTFLKSEYACIGSSFNPLLGQCVENYYCPCGAQETTATTEITTPTSTQCAAPSPGYVFNCEKNGRFADVYDGTCSKYFLCTKLQNGTFLKTEYSCIRSSFNPLLGKCVENYNCPCSGQETTAIATPTVPSCEPPSPGYVFNCEENGRFADVYDRTCSRYFLCSRLRNGTFIKTEYACIGSSFNPLLGKCVENYYCPCAGQETTEITTPSPSSCAPPSPGYVFNCEESGRFADVYDRTCSRYFLCTRLHNGTIMKTAYSCIGSSFNPLLGKCVENYYCPCGGQESTGTIDIRTPTSSQCAASSPGYVFNCEENGRFEDVYDVTCSKYFLCTKLTNGTFLKLEYACIGSSFNPLLGKCVENYNCPCSNQETTAIATPTVPSCEPPSPGYVFNCEEHGRFADVYDRTCSRYFLCTRLQNGTIVKTEYACVKSFFNPLLGKCVENYYCPCTSQETTEITTPSPPPCAPPSPGYVFNCEENGRFPDVYDRTCSRYYLCTRLHNGTIMKTEYACVKSFFNPLLGKCVENYNCPCDGQETTAVTTPTSLPCEPPSPGYVFNCEESGRFADVYDRTCSRYFLCTKLHNGTIMKTEYACVKSFFNPLLGKCVENYNCPCDGQETTAVTTPPSLPCEPPSPGYVFNCEESGRFADVYDRTCSKYFLCTKLQNGTFLKSEYACIGSFFNPLLGKCVENYYCPCGGQESTGTIDIRTPTSSQCAAPSPGYVFNCEENGRFADVYDRTCSKYFLCTKLQNGAFLKSEYACIGSFFNPLLGKCVENYNCPCSGQETTAIATSTVPSCEPPSPGYVFNCEERGRFADVYDVTCSRYFLCTRLRNGTFIKTEYVCIRSSFNPLLGKCVEKYYCPCVGQTTTEITAPTTPPCVPPSPGYVFNCEENGRFPDVYDRTCSRYFLCSRLRNGTFLKTEYACIGSSFNPLLGKCVENYYCPCAGQETTEITEITTASPPPCAPPSPGYVFNCEESGRFADVYDRTCSRYFLCTRLHNGTIMKTEYACVKSFYNPLLGKCVMNYNCPCDGQATTAVTTPTRLPCEPPSPGYVFNCEESGRFPDVYDRTCSRYFLCTRLHDGTIMKTEYACVKSFYNPLLGKCVMNYNCPCDGQATTAVTTPTRLPCEPPSPGYVFNCEESGRFADVYDRTCSRYFLCTRLHNGTIMKTEYACVKSFYNPLLGKCVMNYNCPCDGQATTAVTTPTRLPCEPPSPGYVFNCEESGRFPDVYDRTCSRYFLCTRLHDGTIIKTEYACVKSFFNPLLGKCVKNYNCPCSGQETTAIATSTTGGLITISSRASPYDCDQINEKTPDFKCDRVGRFPDYTDSTCRRYFLCSPLKNGSFSKSYHECPSSSCLNSTLHICSSTCVCPCANKV